jgi:hypothetical protein
MPDEKRTRVPAGLVWEGPFPYKVLARYGITPDSTSQEVLDVSFEIGDALSEPEVNDAWESLRITRNRLFCDFFCPELPAAAPAAPASDEAETLPLPRGFLQGMADWLPDAGKAAGGRRAQEALPNTWRGDRPFWESDIDLSPDEERP